MSSGSGPPRRGGGGAGASPARRRAAGAGGKSPAKTPAKTPSRTHARTPSRTPSRGANKSPRKVRLGEDKERDEEEDDALAPGRVFKSAKSFKKYANKQQDRRLHRDEKQCQVCGEHGPFDGAFCLTHYLAKLSESRRRVAAARERQAAGGGAAAGGAPPLERGKAKPLFSAAAVLGDKATGLDDAAKRRKLCEEVLSTEITYVRSLEGALRFLALLEAHDELGPKIVDSDGEFRHVFGNLRAVLHLHQQLLADLRTLQVDRKLSSPALGELFVRYTPFFRLYSEYVVNYEGVPLALHGLREKARFRQFLAVVERAEGAKLDALLIQPVQRLPRYLLLLGGIEEVTDPAKQSKSLAAIRDALDKVTAITSEVNEEFRRREARERVVTIQELIQDRVLLVSPTRFHVYDGILKKAFGSWHLLSHRSVYVFLLSDVLLYTTMPREGAKVRYRCSLPLMGCSLDEVEAKKDKDLQHGFIVRGRPKDVTFFASTAAERDRWVRLIAERIEVVRRNASTLRLSVDETE